MERDYFVYNGVQYYAGTIVKIKEDKTKLFGYCSCVEFVQYDKENDLYCFVSLHDIWKQYKISSQQILSSIDCIARGVLVIENSNKTLDVKYVDGIVEAFTWYIIIMLCAIFIKGIFNVICVWVVASIIFSNWLRKKINGR